MQTQTYVDETKAKGYVVAAAVVEVTDLDVVRRGLRALLPRSQRRLHMVSESDPGNRHESPYAEPLLWIPDAVGWAHARGGEWRRLADAVVRRRFDV